MNLLAHITFLEVAFTLLVYVVGMATGITLARKWTTRPIEAEEDRE